MSASASRSSQKKNRYQGTGSEDINTALAPQKEKPAYYIHKHQLQENPKKTPRQPPKIPRTPQRTQNPACTSCPALSQEQIAVLEVLEKSETTLKPWQIDIRTGRRIGTERISSILEKLYAMRIETGRDGKKRDS